MSAKPLSTFCRKHPGQQMKPLIGGRDGVDYICEKCLAEAASRRDADTLAIDRAIKRSR